MLPVPEHHPLKRFFAGLVEQAFNSQVGVCDPQLTDYLVDLLAHFVHTDGLHRLRDAEGRRLEQVAAMLESLDSGEERDAGDHSRAVHRHIGDYALFWTGIYPERLRVIRRTTFRDHLIDYIAQGKRSYSIASSLSHGDCLPPASLLNRLSHDFECCVHGLNLVRSCWEQKEPETLKRSRELLY